MLFKNVMIASLIFFVNLGQAKAATLDDNVSLATMLTLEVGHRGVQQMKNGVVDAFNDNTGVDLSNSNYILSAGNVTLVDFLFDGGNGTTVTSDFSSYQRSSLFFNGAEISTTTRLFGSGALRLDGNDDYITIQAPDMDDIHFVGEEENNWTIDFWVKHNDVNSGEAYFSIYENSNNRFNIFNIVSDGLYFVFKSEGTNVQIKGDEITDTNWHRITVCKVADEYGLYFDGHQIGYVQSDIEDTILNDLHFGRLAQGGYQFDGYIDSLKIFQSNYYQATPDSSLTDVLNQYLLLFNFDGTTSDTSIVDYARQRTVAIGGSGPAINDSVSVYGMSSLEFDGTDDYMQLSDSPDWDLMASDTDNWTIDFWVKHNSYDAGYQMYMAQREDTNNRWQIYHYGGYGLTFNVYSEGAQVLSIANKGGISDNNWHHIALVKVGDVFGLYQDGQQIGYTKGDVLDTFAGDLYIGKSGNGVSPMYFDGALDEMHIVKMNHFNASPQPNNSDRIRTDNISNAIQNAYFVPAEGHNASLVSRVFSALSVPTTAKIVIFEEDVDAITENSDLVAEVSRDGGVSWTTMTLVDEGNYGDGLRILSGSNTISAQTSGTDMLYQITTYNTKKLKLHGVSLSWE